MDKTQSMANKVNMGEFIAKGSSKNDEKMAFLTASKKNYHAGVLKITSHQKHPCLYQSIYSWAFHAN